MKVVILAGGMGTRLAEETEVKPKPMVDIGGRPMLWHILKYYAHYGYDEFVVALGYKGEMIKRYFLDYAGLHGSMTISAKTAHVDRHDVPPEDWMIHLMETGLETATGGRLKRLEGMLGGGTFMATYGDGLSNVDLRGLMSFHREHGRLATVTSVRPPARFGNMEIVNSRVNRFTEKPQAGEGWINGGFFVFEPRVLEYISDDKTALEREPLERLAHDGELMAYQHRDFWQCMDTIRDRRFLETVWSTGRAPWKVWE